MKLVCLHDKAEIEAALRRDAEMHLYELGDLDDFFFSQTTWFGLDDRGTLRSIALLYTAVGAEQPVLVALAREGQTWGVTSLLERMRPVLPRKMYAHLAVGASRALEGMGFVVEAPTRHDRMILSDWSPLSAIDTARAVPLGPPDAREIEALFADAYPGNWFDPNMLETKTYFGVREDGVLAAVSGVHVVSRTTRVAAIGNVATRPALRGRGFGRIVVAATCRALRADVDHIGLNVEARSEAIRLYERLGFVRIASYEEMRVT